MPGGDNKEAEPTDEEHPPELEEVLAKHGLGSLIDTFQKEQIDMDSLVSRQGHRNRREERRERGTLFNYQYLPRIAEFHLCLV